ncbi:tyrosine-protein phosphatase [Bradyrhizobium diazoefficiens]|uniref:tyrosine-protein phosphatase n=1 Tax=Bradyrhizobium diazoefficiens TaxID=1355477 RepID=UPI00190AA0A7|nr:tyrosine-protein phosphatase [Bradyrhizobium diazoefficiens]MBK3666324.1 tyrosine-protein phosphatase [Bradyrhizobium diazoefficiens]
MTAERSYHQPIASARRILKEGTFNARDAGGYPVVDGKWLLERRIYRSDALNALSPADVEEFAYLGVRTVIDLRDAREADGAPDLIDRSAVRYERVPIFEDRLFDRDFGKFPSLAALYRLIMDEHIHQLVHVMEILAEASEQPVLVHCTAGKDRTGLVIALLHAIVGLTPEKILEDYGASEKILGGEFEQRLRDLYRQMAVPPEILGDAPSHAPPSYLANTLEDMRARHGSVREFLANNGFGAGKQDHLIRNLTEQVNAQSTSVG